MIPVIIVAATVLVALIGRRAVASGMEWYRTLRLPLWAPSGRFIGLAWAVIYATTATSAIMVFRRTTSEPFMGIAAVFLINAGLHLLWSHLFFQRRRIGAALIEMQVLWATVLLLMALIGPSSPLAAALLIPYAVWVPVASILCWRVWRLN